MAASPPPARETGSGAFIPALRFNSLTPLFDLVVRLTVRDRTIKRRVIERAELAGGERALDVGCGTGTLALAAARAAPDLQITGLDADASILQRARKKAERARVKIAFEQGMADQLPYPDGGFDVVLSTLFFHHLDDDTKRRSAAEIARVLRPSGRVVIGDWGRPHDPLMRAAIRAGVQMLDGTATTALNVRGDLPHVLVDGGLRDVLVSERLRTPSGSFDVITAAR